MIKQLRFHVFITLGLLTWRGLCLRAAAADVQLSLVETDAKHLAVNATRNTVVDTQQRLLPRKYEEIDVSEVESKLKEKGFQFFQGEKLGLAYKKGNNNIVFTNKRYIHVEKWKFRSLISYTSIAWSSIIAWSVLSSGTFRADTGLRLWTNMPQRAFFEHVFWDKKADIYKMKKYISNRVLTGSSSSLLEVFREGGSGRVETSGLPSWLTDGRVEINAKVVEQSLRPGGNFVDVLQDDETVEMAFRAFRDMMIMTSKRILDIDVKGIGGGFEFRSLPYKNVRAFSIETGLGKRSSLGRLSEKDVDMSIWTPVAGFNLRSFYRGFSKNQTDVFAIGTILASHVIGLPNPYTEKKSSSLLQQSRPGIMQGIVEAISWFGSDASEVDPGQAESRLRAEGTLILLEKEHVHLAFKVGHDVTILTDYRVLFIHIKGRRERKIQFKSLPYTSIRAISIESAGSADTDAVLEMWTDVHFDPPTDEGDKGDRPGMSYVKQHLRKGSANIFAISKFLSSKILLGSGASFLEVSAESSSENSNHDSKDLLGWLGDAAEQVDVPSIQEELSHESTPILVPGEAIEIALKHGRNLMVFTTKRLLLVDKKGMSGSRIAYFSVPYSSINGFVVQSGESFDSDAEFMFLTSMWWEKSLIRQDMRKYKADVQRVANLIADQTLHSGDGSAPKSLFQERSSSAQRGPGEDLVAWLSNDAAEIDSAKAEKKIRESSSVFVDDEHISMAYKLGRDSTLLSTKRLLKVDVRGMTGHHREWLSLPWGSVKAYKLTTAANHFSSDVEFKCYTSSIGYDRIKQDFRKGKADYYALEKVLADNMF